MATVSVNFKKTAQSGYFYHADSYESEELTFRKNPVAAKRGYRVKLWITDGRQEDIQLTINGVEEVAEHEKDDLYQIHTEPKVWEQIVGVNLIQSQREKFAAGEARRREKWAQEEREWDERRSRDCCVETQWERNTASQYTAGQDYISTAELPAWMGTNTKIYLGAKKGSGQGPSLQVGGLPNPKQWYTLRINNVWVSFWPGFQSGRGHNPHYAFVTPDEWELIFNYEGGQLPDELAPPRTRNEIRFEGKDLGFSSTEYYEWVEEAKEIQRKVWEVALTYGQMTLFQDNQQGAADRIQGYEAAMNRYAEKISLLDEDLDATAIAKLRRRQSEVEGKLEEVRQYVEAYQKKIDHMQNNYNEASARYKELVARRDYWEEGIHPDNAVEEDNSDEGLVI